MKYDFQDEEQLKKALSKGKKEAFHYVVEHYHQKLCVYALSLCQDENQAQDIVQNLLLKLWVQKDKIQHVKRLSSFLYKSTYNEFIDQYRQSKKVLPLEKKHMETLSTWLENEKDEELEKLMDWVQREIDQLPTKCKHVFLLSKKEGLTNIEIAEYLQISVKSVEAHITNAYKIVKSKMGKWWKILYKFCVFAV